MVNGNGVRENGKMMTDDGDAGNGTGMANGEGKEDSDVDSDAENGNGNGQLGIREMSMDEIINGGRAGGGMPYFWGANIQKTRSAIFPQ